MWSCCAAQGCWYFGIKLWPAIYVRKLFTGIIILKFNLKTMTGAGAFTNRKVISEQRYSSVWRCLFQNSPHKLVLNLYWKQVHMTAMVEHGNIRWGGIWEGEGVNRGMMASQLCRHFPPKIEVIPLFHPKNGIMPLFQLEIICHSFFIFPLQLFYNASEFSLPPLASPTHA